MNDREAFERAIHDHIPIWMLEERNGREDLHAFFQAALAHARQQSAEPVAWAVFDNKLGRMVGLFDSPCEGATPLYRAATQQSAEQVALNLDTIRQAIEERDAAQRALDDLAQQMVYKGNSVEFIYQKSFAYKDALDKAWDALKAAGIKATGSNTVADGIAELAAAPPAAQAEQQDIDDAFREIGTSPLKVVAKMVAVPQQQAEPVAWMYESIDRIGNEICAVTTQHRLIPADVTDKAITPLYAAPPAAQAEPVFWFSPDKKIIVEAKEKAWWPAATIPLYAAPPVDPAKRERARQLAEWLETCTDGWGAGPYAETGKKYAETAKLLKEAYGL